MRRSNYLLPTHILLLISICTSLCSCASQSRTDSSKINDISDCGAFSNSPITHQDFKLSSSNPSIDSKIITSCEKLLLAIQLSNANSEFNDMLLASELFKEYLEQSNDQNPYEKQLAMILHQRTIHRIKILWKLHNIENELLVNSLENKKLTHKINELEMKIKQLKSIESEINEKEQSIISPTVERDYRKQQENPSR